MSHPTYKGATWDRIQQSILTNQEKISLYMGNKFDMQTDLQRESERYRGLKKPKQWINADLNISGRVFTVLVGLVCNKTGTKKRIIIKPDTEFREQDGKMVHGYHCSDYEDLFKFGAKCKGFTSNRHVEIFEKEV